MEVVFATHNAHKVREASKLLHENIKLLSLTDIGFYDEIEETGDSLKENAAIKAEAVYNQSSVSCFADDTGLMIDCLHGEPGVRTSRYAGDDCNDETNILKVLLEMQSCRNRSAHFETVICLRIDEKEIFFNGVTKGTITRNKRGSNGFGYDPVFVPENCNKTYAEMTLEEKNKLSHRSKAVRKLIEYLNMQIV